MAMVMMDQTMEIEMVTEIAKTPMDTSEHPMKIIVCKITSIIINLLQQTKGMLVVETIMETLFIRMVKLIRLIFKEMA